MIYLDLDGVLTDFDLQLSKLIGRHKENNINVDLDPKIWGKIDAEGDRYWSTMPWMPDGKELWYSIKKYHPIILSSPSRHESSLKGKKIWIDREIPGTPYIIEEEKEKYSKVGDILIDDRDKNIKKWEEAGGTGILHKSTKNTLKKLEKILPKYKKIIGNFDVNDAQWGVSKFFTLKYSHCIKRNERKVIEMGSTKDSAAIRDVIAIFKESEDVINPFTGKAVNDLSKKPIKNFLHKPHPSRIRLVKNVLKGLKDPKATIIFSKIEQIEGTDIRDEAHENELKKDIREIAFKYSPEMGEFIGLLIKDFDTTNEDRALHSEMKSLANRISPLKSKQVVDTQKVRSDNWKQHLQKLKELGLRTSDINTIIRLGNLENKLKNFGYSKEASKIESIAKVFEKRAKCSSALKEIRILWDKFKNNAIEFNAHVKDIIEKNRMSYAEYEEQLKPTIEKLTGRSCNLSKSDFYKA